MRVSLTWANIFVSSNSFRYLWFWILYYPAPRAQRRPIGSAILAASWRPVFAAWLCLDLQRVDLLLKLAHPHQLLIEVLLGVRQFREQTAFLWPYLPARQFTHRLGFGACANVQYVRRREGTAREIRQRVLRSTWCLRRNRGPQPRRDHQSYIQPSPMRRIDLRS